MTWSRRFAAPIELPNRRKINTLREAGEYVMSLPKKKQAEQHWQTAANTLLWTAEKGGILQMAEIAMKQAIFKDKPPVQPEAPRKPAKKYRIVR